MPLTRSEIIGYDADKMLFRFTMMNGVQAIDCEISSAALDDLAGTRGTGGFADRNAQFEEYRANIEELASQQFDARPSKLIRVFAKHLPKR
ncbi:DUF1488 family protein [Bradyrhizobium sp. Ash2021]|uniref:DUF1488 family protein n=1 Tax=Bradyrhizobium sp. Ash2021 TaxID=2954771 RepID=UPI0028167A31|nr:DUF1488 family protein [Bradyrhizobium sp. Ash2021]WMT79399.1 DUF1488 domain-containing protein [Bradyrhizobium sp. Ash2021]